MPPEVLAWALLFVAGCGVVYRFGDWLLRRSQARQSPAIVAPRAENAPPAEAPAALAVSSPPFRTPVAELHPAAVPPSAPANVPMPERARHEDGPAAVEAAMPTETTDDAPPPRIALKPSIAATLPPKPSAPPAPLAVSSPPFRTPVAGVRQADASPGVPANVPTPAPAAHYAAAIAPTPPPGEQEAAASSPAPSPELVSPDISAARRTSAPRKFLLRAWKLGEVAPRLDIRLKESRSRKVITIAKALRKAAEKPPTAGGLKVLSPRSAPEKAPVRRIGRKLDAASLLASMPAQKRVVGVRTRRFRVLSVTEL